MADLDPQLNYAPDDIRHIHIMGICGTGMAVHTTIPCIVGHKILWLVRNDIPPETLSPAVRTYL